MTTQEAQSFLASQLPEEIYISKSILNTGEEQQRFFWRFRGLVENTEWDYIARQVELKLPEKLKRKYGTVMFDKCIWPQFSEVPDKNGGDIEFAAITPDYLTRATVLKEVLSLL
jgi:hypothetical protein